MLHKVLLTIISLPSVQHFDSDDILIKFGKRKQYATKKGKTFYNVVQLIHTILK